MSGFSMNIPNRCPDSTAGSFGGDAEGRRAEIMVSRFIVMIIGYQEKWMQVDETSTLRRWTSCTYERRPVCLVRAVSANISEMYRFPANRTMDYSPCLHRLNVSSYPSFFLINSGQHVGDPRVARSAVSCVVGGREPMETMNIEAASPMAGPSWLVSIEGLRFIWSCVSL